MANKTKALNLRIEPETLAALKAQAKREGRTLSALVSRILAAATKRDEAKRRKSRA